MAIQLTQTQIDERVAILKRFRSLLEEQRNKFREYLMVLESQQGKIENEDADSLVAHTELEQQIVKNISSLHKVIRPMQSMYNAISKNDITESENASVLKIQADLTDLQNKVLAQNKKNRDLLKVHISQIREQLTTLNNNNPYRGTRSIYAEKAEIGNLITVEV
ncbi:MAG: flagellar biosynthesis protein FlgN [Treponema sp.]|nr:flagellar biosynthesis protein FlgN [Treponema sp.]